MWILWIFISVLVILLLFDFKSVENMQYTVCYDQQSFTGIGDRLLDLCSVMVQAPDSKIMIKWNDATAYKTYDYKNSLEIENGEFLNSVDGVSCNKLTLDKESGRAVPSMDQIDTFRKVAKRIRPSYQIEQVIPGEKYTCIHIRATDKIQKIADGIHQTQEEFDKIKQTCIDYVKNNIEKTYVICSDDETTKTKFIEECGEGLKLLTIEYGNLDKAFVDLFVLSRSERIIQCTKYSTFSIVASIIGGIPLVNFSGLETMGKGDEYDWKPVLFSE